MGAALQRAQRRAHGEVVQHLGVSSGRRTAAATALRTLVLFIIDISAHLCYILRSAVMGAAVEGVMP